MDLSILFSGDEKDSGSGEEIGFKNYRDCRMQQRGRISGEGRNYGT